MQDVKSLYEVKQLLGTQLYARSLRLVQSGSVENYQDNKRTWSNGRELSATVDGRYCEITRYEDGDIYPTCNCKVRREGYLCEHLGALMITILRKRGASLQDERIDDENASQLMQPYENALEARPALVRYSLTPVLSFEEGCAFAAFKISDGEKSFQLMALSEFVRLMRRGETAIYGGKLTVRHDINAFDERSVLLYRMIEASARWLDALLVNKRQDVRQGFGEIRQIPLTGESFDRIFDLYLGEKLNCKGEGVKLLTQEDPQGLFAIQPDGDRLRITGAEDVLTYDSGTHGYVVIPKKICRVSRAYLSDLLPMMRELHQIGGSLTLSRRRAEEFCLNVAPRISAYASGDSLTALIPFLPEALQVRAELQLRRQICGLRRAGIRLSGHPQEFCKGEGRAESAGGFF